MNTKRSYIESLNVGRPRREHATLEDLNRSLASLDERFSRNLQEEESARDEGDIASRMRRLSGASRRVGAGYSRDHLRIDPASDFEDNRARETGSASMSKIATELNTLRQELRSRLEGAMESTEFGAGGPAPQMHAEPAGSAPPSHFSSADDHAIAGVADRLEKIHSAVGALTESLALPSLENKMKTLATAVEHLARQKEMPGPSTFEAIEERLDEISRAIVASSAPSAPAFDSKHLERIEARINSLSHQLEELVEDRPVDAVMKQLSALSARVEDIAGRAELPETSVDRLSQQIDLIVAKLEDGKPPLDPDMIFQGMERRFETLTQALEQRHETAREQSVALFRDLEERLERYNQEALSTDAAIVEALNKRFNDLEDAISRPGRNASGASGPAASTAMSQPQFEDIAPRLELIERSVSESRDAIIGAAREAAEQAVRVRDLPEGDLAVLSGLAEELQSLEKLARKSDERNTRTFEAIHDTLLQIVDRLGALEGGTLPSRSTEEEPVRNLDFAESPSLDLENAEPLSEEAPRVETHAAAAVSQAEVVPDPKRSPAEAAAAAAMAAVSSSETVAPKSKAASKQSRLGKLSRAFSRKKVEEKVSEERREPSADVETEEEAAAPEVGLDTPLDPKLANQPLEPGSGAPDLNAIMRRVRDERGDEGRARDAEAAKSDFIAAARRAAQAAAAEAEVLKKKTDPKNTSRGLSLKRLLRSNTKIVLFAAGVVLVGVAGTQLGKALLKDGSHKTATARSHSTVSTVASKKKTETASSAAEKKAVAMSPIMPTAVSTDAASTASPTVAQTEEAQASTVPASTAAPAKTSAATAEGNPASTKTGDEKTVASAMPEKENAAVTPDRAPASSAPAALAANESGPTANAMTPFSGTSGSGVATHLGAVSDTTEDTSPAVSNPDETGEAISTAMMPVPTDAGPLPLREAAEGGDPKATFVIASRYAEGRDNAAPDMSTAAKWYEQAAGLGFAPAEYRIGNFYEKGIGVKRDIAKAEGWYKKAAEQGNAAAMHNLAVLYAMGADGPVNNEAAVRWFEKAAELGVKDSQFNLGILAAKGVGMPQNLEESYKWFALVAKTGDKDAAAKRDEVANSLRPEQLQKARAATELWKARPVDQAANIVDIPDAWKESNTKTASIDMTQAVKNIQLILNKNGYDAGAADGIMGDKTKSAIADFQKANGMEPTGEVNEALVTALLKKK